MDEHEALSHTTWDCKYHVVFIPKCRRKTLYLELRGHLGEVFRKLAAQKESKILEGHLMLDHVHMLILIPPKYAVSEVVGFIKERRMGPSTSRRTSGALIVSGSRKAPRIANRPCGPVCPPSGLNARSRASGRSSGKRSSLG